VSEEERTAGTRPLPRHAREELILALLPLAEERIEEELRTLRAETTACSLEPGERTKCIILLLQAVVAAMKNVHGGSARLPFVPPAWTRHHEETYGRIETFVRQAQARCPALLELAYPAQKLVILDALDRALRDGEHEEPPP